MLRTSLRGDAHAATWRRAKRVAQALGITRVTDITQLDRLGLPVFASIRPRGFTLRVHAGKGFHPEDARVGALMEAIETAVAELDARAPADARRSWAALEAGMPSGVNLASFAPQLDVAFNPLAETDALWCEQVGAPSPVLLPAQLMRLRAPGAQAEPMLYPWSSNGLASGNDVDEATLHGLLELVERDSRAMHAARDESCSVPIETLPPAARAWVENWRELGAELYVRHLPNGFGLPCFEAVLHLPDDLGVNLAHGSGCHTDRDIALARAVSEAAQSRLSALHGGRDDVTDFFAKYDGSADGETRARDLARIEAAHVARLRDASRSVAFVDLPTRRFQAPAPALRHVLAALSAGGVGPVFRRVLEPGVATVPWHGLAVVKLVVAGLEMLEDHNRRVGPRLVARLAAAAKAG